MEESYIIVYKKWFQAVKQINYLRNVKYYLSRAKLDKLFLKDFNRSITAFMILLLTGLEVNALINSRIENENNILNTIVMTEPCTTITESYNGCEGDGYSVVVNGTTYDESNPTGTEVISNINSLSQSFEDNPSCNPECIPYATSGDWIIGDASSSPFINPSDGDKMMFAAFPTNATSTLTFGSIDLAAYPGLGTFSFDWEMFKNSPESFLRYEMFYDGIGQGEVDIRSIGDQDDFEDGPENGLVSIVLPPGVSTFSVEIDFEGAEDEVMIDNVLFSSEDCMTINIDLVFNPSLTITESYNGCEGDGYSVVVNGTTYDESNPTGTEVISNIKTLSQSFEDDPSCDPECIPYATSGDWIIGDASSSPFINPSDGDKMMFAAFPTNATSTLTFGSIDLAAYPGLGTFSFDWEMFKNSPESFLRYEMFYDGIGQGEVDIRSIGDQDDFEDGPENGLVSIVLPPGVSTFSVEIDFEGAEDEVMIDNVLFTAGGCDTTVNIDLVFNPSPTITESYNGCEGDGYSVVVNGTTYDESNPTGTEVISNINSLSQSFEDDPSCNPECIPYATSGDWIIGDASSSPFINPSDGDKMMFAAFPTNATSTLTFGSIDLAAYPGLGTFSFDWEMFKNSPESFLRYEMFYDGIGQGEVDIRSIGDQDDFEDGPENGLVSIVLPPGVSTFSVEIDFEGAEDEVMIDNVLFTAGGCDTTVNIDLVFNPNPSCSITVNNHVTCIDGSDGSAMVTPSGGEAPFTYLWDDPGASTTETINNLSAGTYGVTVTDTNGCTTSCNVEITEPELGADETAFAKNNNDSECFIDNGFDRWGWSNYFANEGIYTLDLYAGAGQCNLDNGVLAGNVIIDYSNGEITATYNLFDGYVMTELHLYVGCTPYPLKRKNETVAPGQYPFNVEDLNRVSTYTIGPIDVSNLEGGIYVIAHAVTHELINSELCPTEDNGGVFTPTRAVKACTNGQRVTENSNLEETIQSDMTTHFKVYPVPFENEININYALTYDTEVVIEVYDIRGRLIREFRNLNYSKGIKTTMKIDLSRVNTQLLFIRLTTDEEVLIKKIVSVF